MFLVLGSSVSFVASGSFSTPGGGIGGGFRGRGTWDVEVRLGDGFSTKRVQGNKTSNLVFDIAVGNKMHKAFSLLVRKFPLPEGTSHCLKKNATTRRKVLPLPEVCTAIIVKEKPSVKDDRESLSIHISLSPFTQSKIWINNIPLLPKYLCWILENSSNGSSECNNIFNMSTMFCGSKHKTAKELWAAILKTFGGNEATKKTKKNILKQQYGNFRAEGSETLEQTFTRLQVIVVWRNRSDLDTMSLDDLGNDEVNTASVYTASSNVPTASANVATVSISQETACAYIASQSGGSQIKFEDINQIKENDMEEMDIKWNMALLSMRADKFLKKTGKKISIQGSDVAGQGSKAKEQTPKALMAIDGVGWDWSYMVNNKEDHALVAEAPTDFALMADTSTENKGKVEYIKTLKMELETLKQEKEVMDGKIACLLSASKNLDNLIESQRSDMSKEECADDTVTDYSRPSPTVESSSEEDQNRNPFAYENVASPITPKQFVKFVKASDSQSKSKTDEKETPEKPPVKNAEQYRKPNKKPNVRGNQRNWNNLKSHQLGPDFVMKKKACFNCGDFNHLAYECRKRVIRGTTRTPFNKSAHSYTNRPFQRKSTVRSQYRAPWVPTVNRNFLPVNSKFSTGDRNFPTVSRKFPTASRKFPTGSTKGPTADKGIKGKAGSSQNHIDDKGYWDSGCSRHMTGNISYLSDYEPFDGGYVSFGQGGCKITGKKNYQN
nr:ribonuclease H-like domain-containing protein [Tanacetum cinerariifolium]